MRTDLEQKKKIFTWSDPKTDGLPPHLYVKEPPVDPVTKKPLAPPDLPQGELHADIFNATLQVFVGQLAETFTFVIPDNISTQFGAPFVGPSIAECEKYNSDHPTSDTDIMVGSNIGDYKDWYSDARFAQQHLSGVNPCTIEAASADKVKPYIEEAKKQGLAEMATLLSKAKDLLIQDYSYFRKATGVTNDQDFSSKVVNDPTKATALEVRYACASVIIFELHGDGRLHPLAITLDHRGSLDKSVTIFNQRLRPDDKGKIDEKDDWPWRYAKTCAQTADWARHEIAVHLVETHMIEEAIIVATNRTIPETHLLYDVLSPHWFRTLALNYAARRLMVPGVVCRLAGFGPSMNPATSNVLKFAQYSYENFNFQEKYVPNDLKKRGFHLQEEMSEKYRNYPYGSIMFHIWGMIRDFVAKVLGTKYKHDTDVTKDTYIADWCKEIQEQGQIKTFPTIKTVDQLVDAVTMCIHIASTQHTAVNYLQEYYYTFIPAKPAALCTPLPKDLKTLQSYTEKDLTAALPIGKDGAKWKDWLLSAQLPKLLSFKVDGRYNLITYAKSLYNVNKSRTILERKEFDTETIKDAAAKFYENLKNADFLCDYVSDCQTEGSIPYPVLKPELTAVSILI